MSLEEIFKLVNELPTIKQQEWVCWLYSIVDVEAIDSSNADLRLAQATMDQRLQAYIKVLNK